MASDLVFGYGSLPFGAPGACPATLAGARRVWGVAMDNRAEIPGYKVYRRRDGSRPAVHVAFLDLDETQDGEVNGVLVAVDAAGLAALDARERNYRRIDVTGRAQGAGGARVWAYAGSDAGRARLARGRAAGDVVISRDYLDLVHDGFRRLGPGEHERFVASTEPEPFPVEDLERVDLPV